MTDQTIVLAPHQTAVIGYGSLLSVASIARTLHGAYHGPFITTAVAGWRRSWNVSMPNAAFYYMEGHERVYPQRIRYLNVVHDAQSVMNCALFIVERRQLDLMHGREWIYDAHDVTAQLRGVHVTGSSAIMYVAKPEHLELNADSPRVSAIRRSYVRVVNDAVAAMPESFQKVYRDTTDAPPAHLIIDDHLDMERPNPWAAGGTNYRPELSAE